MIQQNQAYQLSSHINNIIEKKPNWLIRFGIGGMLLFLCLIFVAAGIVKYPDTIVGTVTITTPKPPVDLISQVSSPIHRVFKVFEGDTLKKHDPILLLESTTSNHQILILKKQLELDETMGDSIYRQIPKLDSLGFIQDFYNQYKTAREKFINYYKNFFYDKQIASLKNILLLRSKNVDYAKVLTKSSNQDFQLHNKALNRYKKLYHKSVVSPAEYESVKQSLLRKQMSHSNDFKALNSEYIAIASLQSDILDLEIQKIQYEQQLKGNYEKSVAALKNAVSQWESKYFISAPTSGRLAFFSRPNEGDFIATGEHIFTIIPLQKEKLQAIGIFPAKSVGKVEIKDKVVLKLDAFPYHQYGTVIGYVSRISEIPKDNLYHIIIDLPNNLNTSYEKKINFKQRLGASAEIITEEKSLLNRIFFQLESLVKN